MRFLATSFLLLFCKILSAQQVYESYSPANGLVDARVSNMVQDKYGRLVFLTREGFSIFDGQRFSNYLSVDGVEVGITDDFIFLPDSTLYLVRFSGGGIRIDKDKVSFEPHFLNGITEISTIKRRAADDYIIISNSGLYRFRKQLLVPLLNKNPDFDSGINYIQNAGINNSKILLSKSSFKKGYQLSLYDFNRQEILAEQRTSAPVKITDDAHGNLFVLFTDKLVQVDSLSLSNNQIVLKTPWFIPYLPIDFPVEDFFFDRLGNAWCVNRLIGICKVFYDGHHRVFYPRSNGMLTSATAVFEDAENNYWLMCPGNGVQKILQSRFEKVSSNGGFDLSSIQLLHNVPGEGMFIGAISGSYMIAGDTIRRISNYVQSYGMSGFYWKGEIWHFENKSGLLSSSGKRKRFIFTDSSTAELQPSTKIVTDRKGNLVITGNYIYLLNRDGNAYAAQLPYFSDKVAIDDEDNYWIFSRGGLLVKYSFENDRLKRLLYFKTTNEAPRCAAHWQKDIFIVGTRTQGLFFARFSEKGMEKLRQLNRADGLSNNFVLNVVKLDSIHIVAGTASGLDIITIEKGDTSIRKLSLGINNFEPVYNLTVDDNGKVFASSESTNNLFTYTPDKFNSLQYKPMAYISHVYVNGDLAADLLKLNYRQNNFRFEVTASSYIDNNNINFYYTLESANGESKFNNNTGTLLVNNLEPGSYSLKVRIVYPGNLYPDTTLSCRFLISQPFWKTWWFITLLTVLVLGGIYFITRFYYYQQIRKKEAELEKQKAVEQERTRISTDMHDDFGANLSRIKFLSEKIKLLQQGDEQLNNDLSKISGYSDEMAEKMNEIVWALNQKYDSMGDLLAFCRSYASEYLSNHQVALSFTGDDLPDMKIPGEIRRNIFLVIKESLFNVVKHAGASAVNIVFKIEKGLVLTIADNGKGIDLDHIRPFANGLDNMRKRIASIHGEFNIENNNGTQLSIYIPLEETK